MSSHCLPLLIFFATRCSTRLSRSSGALVLMIKLCSDAGPSARRCISGIRRASIIGCILAVDSVESSNGDRPAFNAGVEELELVRDCIGFPPLPLRSWAARLKGPPRFAIFGGGRSELSSIVLHLVISHIAPNPKMPAYLPLGTENLRCSGRLLVVVHLVGFPQLH